VPPRNLVIVGTGGTSVDIFDAVLAQRAAGDASFDPFCFLDDNPSRIGQTLHGLPVKGPLESARDMADCVFISGIGSPGNFWRRDEFVRRLGVAPDRFATVVHPTASVSSLAEIGLGTAILQHVTISANARVGSHVVILPNSIVSHDCTVGDYTCITGGVCLSGNVDVDEFCYLGSNCSVIGGRRIHAKSLVGIGSVVLEDVQSNTVVVGNPARFLRGLLPSEVTG
jgi:sugar O-acyltransferase (sialic acid O-acetyltransferase NeuD family)